MRTIVYIGASLDGFIARKDGEIDWLVQFANDEAFSSYEELIGRIDAFVIGRGTFEKVLGFPTWPYTKEVFELSISLKSGIPLFGHLDAPLNFQHTSTVMGSNGLVRS